MATEGDEIVKGPKAIIMLIDISSKKKLNIENDKRKKKQQRK